MRKICIKFLAATLLAGIAVPASLHAATIYVGNCGTPSKPTIQQAVNASTAGGTVLICPGNYPEQVTITKNLTLQGLLTGTSGQVVITPPAGGVVQNTTDLYNYGTNPVAAQVLVQKAGNVVLNNIVVDGAGNGLSSCAVDLRGIYYQNASGTIENVTTRNQFLASGSEESACYKGGFGTDIGFGIYVQSGYGTSTTAQSISVLNNNVRAFGKNGITVDGSPITFLVEENNILGQGPTSTESENGIQVSDGATGKVLYNSITNLIYTGTIFGAAGIYVYASEGVEVGYNGVGVSQYGIATQSDSTSPSIQDPTGVADKTYIHDNVVVGTQNYDGLDICSNGNTVTNNKIFASTESAIHLDSTCGSTGKNNVVTSNNINEACAGILEGATPNTIGSAATANSLFNVASTVLQGDACPAIAPSAVSSAVSADALRQIGAGSGRSHPVPAR